MPEFHARRSSPLLWRILRGRHRIGQPEADRSGKRLTAYWLVLGVFELSAAQRFALRDETYVFDKVTDLNAGRCGRYTVANLRCRNQYLLREQILKPFSDTQQRHIRRLNVDQCLWVSGISSERRHRNRRKSRCLARALTIGGVLGGGEADTFPFTTNSYGSNVAVNRHACPVAMAARSTPGRRASTPRHCATSPAPADT